jgi:two-component system phosphate regulon response regulator OmpR
MSDVSPRILLVDNARLRELLLRYLQSQGFDVRGACDAVQMQHRLDRGHFDLIVLDLMLPDEDGLQICLPTAQPRR